MTDKIQAEPPVSITSHSDRGTLEAVMEDLHRQGKGNSKAHHVLWHSEEATHALADYLGSLGIRNYAVANRGSYSFTFTTSNHQLVRIAHKKEFAADAFPPTVLKPLVTVDLAEVSPALKDLRLSILPQVMVGEQAGITHEEAVQLIKDTACYDRFFYDSKYHNIGRLSDGTPVIIDLGALEPGNLSALMNNQRFRGIYTHENDFIFVNLPSTGKSFTAIGIEDLITRIGQSPSRDYEKAQEAHWAKHGLKPGEVAGTFKAPTSKHCAGPCCRIARPTCKNPRASPRPYSKAAMTMRAGMR